MRSVAEPDDRLTDAERRAKWKPKIFKQDKREWGIAHLEDSIAGPFDGYKESARHRDQDVRQDRQDDEVQSTTPSDAPERNGRGGLGTPGSMQNGWNDSDTLRSGNEEIARRGGYFGVDDRPTQRIKSEEIEVTRFIHIDDSDSDSGPGLFFPEHSSGKVVDGTGTAEEPYLLDED